MVSEELKLIIDELNIQGKMIFLEATTKEKITTFEREKMLRFHPNTKKGILLIRDVLFVFVVAKVCHINIFPVI